MNRLASAALVAALTIAPLAAHATVYAGMRTVNSDTATFSITTDGAVGVLATADITAFSFSFTDPVAGTLSGSDLDGGQFVIEGSGLSASATQLSFDFASNGGVVFQVGGDPAAAYCVDGPLAIPTCVGEQPGGNEFIVFVDGGQFVNNNFSVPQAGVQVLATAVTGGAPEPAAWSLMIAGFGLAGAGLRRRRTIRA